MLINLRLTFCMSTSISCAWKNQKAKLNTETVASKCLRLNLIQIHITFLSLSGVCDGLCYVTQVISGLVCHFEDVTTLVKVNKVQGHRNTNWCTIDCQPLVKRKKNYIFQPVTSCSWKLMAVAGKNTANILVTDRRFQLLCCKNCFPSK